MCLMRIVHEKDNQPSNPPAATYRPYAPPFEVGGAAALYLQSGPGSNTGKRHALLSVSTAVAPSIGQRGMGPGVRRDDERGFSDLLLDGLQHRDVVRDRGAAHVEDAAELRALELHAFRRLARKLHRRHHMHGYAGGTDRVALGFQSAGRIDRQLAILLGPAFQDGAGALPLWRQAHRFILD